MNNFKFFLLYLFTYKWKIAQFETSQITNKNSKYMEIINPLKVENNINLINSIYLGQGLNISNNPFIYQESNETIFSANAINISSTKDDVKKDNDIYYPINFFYLVFISDDKIFYLSKSNCLIMFKFNGHTFERYEFQHEENR